MNKTILVIEDDPDVRLGYQMRLNANHYDVIFASDGYMSLVQALTRPDLIILDLEGLPAGDGFPVLERLRAIPILSRIPVIVVSALDSNANKERALLAGDKAAFLQRPVAKEELLTVIKHYITRGAVAVIEDT